MQWNPIEWFNSLLSLIRSPQQPLRQTVLNQSLALKLFYTNDSVAQHLLLPQLPGRSAMLLAPLWVLSCHVFRTLTIMTSWSTSPLLPPLQPVTPLPVHGSTWATTTSRARGVLSGLKTLVPLPIRTGMWMRRTMAEMMMEPLDRRVRCSCPPLMELGTMSLITPTRLSVLVLMLPLRHPQQLRSQRQHLYQLFNQHQSQPTLPSQHQHLSQPLNQHRNQLTLQHHYQSRTQHLFPQPFPFLLLLASQARNHPKPQLFTPHPILVPNQHNSPFQFHPQTQSHNLVQFPYQLQLLSPHQTQSHNLVQFPSQLQLLSPHQTQSHNLVQFPSLLQLRPRFPTPLLCQL
mmetsp:Transcript_35708/g.42012  ORF Transcript_35708/g.42012 Transcript_35708/m.42012 type:complete len:345 (+) Transcript_35708:1757-2791(+)